MASKKSDNYLVISDLQIPFEAPYALQFCKEVVKEFHISKENILNVGDELDEYFGSQYERDPDALHTPNSEIRESIDKLRPWYEEFPLMRLAESNHGMRWARKAFSAGIPSVFLRRYQEVVEAPSTWRWQRAWLIQASRKPFLMVHGMGYSGMYAHRQMAVNNGISTVHGHLHGNAGIAHIRTDGLDIWGMNTGCLIDRQSYAFQYAKENKFKETLGLGVVLDGGLTPIWLPYPYEKKA